jgi:predicted MFS family arabinose efflux permease
VLLEIFSFIQIKSDDPLIQLRLFRNPAFAIDCVLLFCIQFAMISLIVFGAIYLQKNLGFTPLEAGLGIMPIIISVVIMSQVSGRLFDRVGVKVPALTGAFLIAAGFFLQAPFLEGGDFLNILPGMILLGFGIGFVMVPRHGTRSTAPERVQGGVGSRADDGQIGRQSAASRRPVATVQQEVSKI